MLNSAKRKLVLLKTALKNHRDEKKFYFQNGAQDGQRKHIFLSKTVLGDVHQARRACLIQTVLKNAKKICIAKKTVLTGTQKKTVLRKWCPRTPRGKLFSQDGAQDRQETMLRLELVLDPPRKHQNGYYYQRDALAFSEL